MDKKQREMARAEIRRMVREEADPIIAEMNRVAKHLGEVQEEIIRRAREQKTGGPAWAPPIARRRGMIRG